jgi:tRNA(fMet)-specific endonuclease VapC
VEHVKVLLDTNAYARFIAGHRPLVDLVEAADEVLISTIVLGEVLVGVKMGTRAAENTANLRDFLDDAATAVLDVTDDVADRYSEIFAHLRSAGTPIPTNDIWIAATALEAGARLVTYDDHFHFVPGLIVVDP